MQCNLNDPGTAFNDGTCSLEGALLAALIHAECGITIIMRGEGRTCRQHVMWLLKFFHHWAWEPSGGAGAFDFQLIYVGAG